MTKQEIIKEIKAGSTLEQLEEIGYIDIDFIEHNLQDFIQALEEVTNNEYTITDRIGKRVIEQY